MEYLFLIYLFIYNTESECRVFDAVFIKEPVGDSGAVKLLGDDASVGGAVLRRVGDLLQGPADHEVHVFRRLVQVTQKIDILQKKSGR